MLMLVFRHNPGCFPNVQSSAYLYPHLISYLNQQLVPEKLACLGQPFHLAARYHCRYLLCSVLALWEPFDLDLWR